MPEDLESSALEPGLPADLDRGLRAAYRSRDHAGASVLDRLRRHSDRPQGGRLSPDRRYRIVGEIARGGVGAVYHGHDVDLGRDVALKVLHERFANDGEILRRFIEEAQIGGQLQHPGIVPVYELGLEAHERPFFAMKLVRGSTLAQVLRERGSPSQDRRRILGIFEQVCQTMAYSHARRVVHRDLKPANVMVGAFGEVQVVDWGFAKVLSPEGAPDEPRPAGEPREAASVETVRSRSDSGSHSVSGSVMGTLAYMPPEQARGDVERMDERSDVFGLGAILCEILTGFPPYVCEEGPGEDLFHLATGGHLEAARHRLGSCGADEPLVQVALACLAAAPHERPRDAGVVAERIGAYLGSVEERARRSEVDAAASRERAEGERRARRLTLALATSIGVTLLAGGGSLSYVKDQAQKQRLAVERDVQAQLQEGASRAGQALAMQDPGMSTDHWREAVAAVERAGARLDQAEPDPALRATVDARLAELEDRLSAAEDLVVRRRRESRMVVRLQELRLPVDEDVTHPEWPQRELHRLDAAYAAAFEEFGFDPFSPGPVAAGGIAVDLAVALDHWATVRRRLAAPGPLVSPADRISAEWIAMARALDDDPWRDRLRDLLLRNDLSAAALQSVARSEELIAQPPVTLDLLGSLLFAAGLPGLAEEVYAAGHEFHPDAFSLAFFAGLACELQPEPDWRAAARYYEVARSLEPGIVEAHHRLGMAWIEAGELAAARAVFEGMTRADPDRDDPWSHLGHVRFHEGDVATAVDAYRRAAALHPTAGHLLDLGEALLGAGRATEAAQELRRSTQLDPDEDQAWNSLGVALDDAGDLPGGIEAWREATRIDDRAVPPWCNLADALRRAGDVPGALAACARLREIDPDHDDVWIHIGRARLAAGEAAEAVTALRRYVEQQPQDAKGWYWLGNASQAGGDLGAAQDAWEQATAVDPEYAEAWCNLGGACRERALAVPATEVERQLDLLLRSQECYRRGDALGRRRGDAWTEPSERWVREAGRLLEEARYRPYLTGQREAGSPGEWLEIAAVAYDLDRYAASLRAYLKAFAGDPSLLDEDEGLYRARATCIAALVGSGRGRDATVSDDDTRAAARWQALDWLEERLEVWREAIAAEGDGAERARAALGELLQHHCTDALRGEEALARLPAEEARAWRAFWAEVDDLLD